MAASLRSARPVAKAVLPNRVGRLGHRLSEPILTTKARPGILLSPTPNLSRGRARLAEHAQKNGPPSVKDVRRRPSSPPRHGKRGSRAPSHRSVATKVRSCPILDLRASLPKTGTDYSDKLAAPNPDLANAGNPM